MQCAIEEAKNREIDLLNEYKNRDLGSFKSSDEKAKKKVVYQEYKDKDHSQYINCDTKYSILASNNSNISLKQGHSNPNHQKSGQFSLEEYSHNPDHLIPGQGKISKVNITFNSQPESTTTQIPDNSNYGKFRSKLSQ